jgi:ERCC4-type nuclease
VAILVDDRTGSADLAPHVSACGVEVEVTRLEYGDAAWFGNGPEGGIIPVGVELKAIGDLLRVIADGRFAGHQLPGLLTHYSRVYLVVEGLMKEGEGGELMVRRGPLWAPVSWGRRTWRYSEVDSWLATMEELGGVRVRATNSRGATAKLLCNLHNWWTRKEYEEHRSHLADYTPPPPPAWLVRPNLVTRMAKEIDGFGWEKGRAVGAHFHSPREMTNAGVEEWQRIKGVGKGLSARAAAAMVAVDGTQDTQATGTRTRPGAGPAQKSGTTGG